MYFGRYGSGKVGCVCAVWDRSWGVYIESIVNWGLRSNFTQLINVNFCMRILAKWFYFSFVIATIVLFHSPVFGQKTRIQSKKNITTITKEPVNPYAAIDKRMLTIPDSASSSVSGIAYYINNHFEKRKEKIRAAFIWVAGTIDYDVDNMYALNFFESQDDKALKTLVTKKGVCQQFASLFNMIALELGFKTYLVTGYTRQKGHSDFVPHAWSAVYEDDDWHLYDPTWASGYILNGKYVHHINNDFFDITPNAMIETHFPFDYIWQLKDFPVKTQAFAMGKYSSDKDSANYRNYKDSINTFLWQPREKQLKGEMERLSYIGINNTLSYSYMHDLAIVHESLQLQKQQLAENKIVDQLNSAGTLLNTSQTIFNNYINYRNAHFKPTRKDDEIQQMLDSTVYYVNKADPILKEYANVSGENKQNYIRQLNRQRNELVRRHGEEKIWLANYLSKGKLGRALILETMRVVN